MNKVTICFFILSLSLASCEKGNDCCVNVEANISISGIISNDIDYIGQIDHDNITIYYFDGIDYVLVDNPDRDISKGFEIVPPSNNGSKYVMEIALNTDYLNSDDVSLTRINWTDNDSDILEAKFYRTNNNLVLSTVSIGDEIVWESSKNGIVILEK